MLKQLNKLTVQKHLLQKEEENQQKKPKYSNNMAATRNGRWLSQVCKCDVAHSFVTHSSHFCGFFWSLVISISYAIGLAINKYVRIHKLDFSNCPIVDFKVYE